MGRAVAAAAAQDPRTAVVGGVGRATAGALPGLLAGADVLVDFSLPAPALRAVRAAARAGVPAVVGTTGFSPAQMASLRAASRRIALFWAPNMSLGMTVLIELAARAAAALPLYDAAVLDVHHARKKDAPSGSARRLMEAVASARGGRRVPAASLRVGDVTGDHTVILAGPGERLELVHRAQSREVFARSALAAAAWTAGKRPGFYGMRDLVGP